MKWTPLLASSLRAMPFAVVLFALALPIPSHAAWPHSPGINLPVCTATGDQDGQQIVSDGAGGAILTWHDARCGNNDIYAQRVRASGGVGAAWRAAGGALFSA